MFLLLLIAASTLLICYIKWNYSYWQRKGFPYVEAKIPFGILDSMRTREHSLGMAIYDVYKKSQEKLLGVYLLTRPALLVRDAQLARDILTKDFSSFHDRGIYVDDENDPMSGNLLALQGQKWKTMRTKLAPSFTSGKLRSMFTTIDDISNKLLAHIQSQLPDDGVKQLEMKSILSTYAIDIIGSVIFGLEVNSFENPSNSFHNLKTQINDPGFTSIVRNTAQFIYPGYAIDIIGSVIFGLEVNSFENPSNSFHNLKTQINDPGFTSIVRNTAQFIYPGLEKIFVRMGWKEFAPEFMKNIVRETVEFREKNNVSRKDMLQLLLQLRNTGKINSDDNEWAAESTAGVFKSMSIEMIAAQLFLFYIAGYETSASAASFTIYELAQYPDLLTKAQKDVEGALERHNGQLTYDTIQDMKFIDLCIMETIRKYPGLPILNRECTKDYPIPDSNLVIKEGTPIIISLFGMHRDAKYFPDPMRYDPERFLEENMNYDPVAYMPFGEGPRHCIAQRMGKVNVKVALAKILTNFNIEINEERKEIEIDNFGIPIVPKGGINVRLSKKHRATIA